MPRIDPFQLLKCLSVLLGPTGGIKSKEEVHRLANLMTKFSKKLVSKCIYIQILKTTDTELLSQFMDAGGWSLIHMWLTDGIVAKNWALIQELLELLLLCPVKIERLKSNNCPKLIKGLSKEVSHQIVRILAGHLVEQWLKIVKGEAAPNSVPAQIIGNLPPDIMLNSMGQLEHQYTNTCVTSGSEVGVASSVEETLQVQNLDQTNSNPAVSSEGSKMSQVVDDSTSISMQATKQSSFVSASSIIVTSTSVPLCKITIRDGDQVLAKVETEASNINNSFKGNATHEMNGDIGSGGASRDDDFEESGGSSEDKEDGAVNHLVSSEVKQQTAVSAKDAQSTANAKSKDDKNFKDTVSSDSNKSSDKENRDSHKTDDKKSSGSCNNSSSSSISSESKKSSGGHHHGSSSRSGNSSSSKHGSSSHRTGSSSHKSSHRSGSSSSSRSSSSKDKSSREKDRHSSSSSKHSSSSSSNRNKSERDKEREKEKEKLKKDQAEKDKATLEKVQAQVISVKLGKIPRKKPEDEKSSGDSLLRKSSTDSRDSSKENKEKTDSKKISGAAGTPAPVAPASVLEKKQISISIENRKNSQDSSRPKTVKTFNSKFRSTGLEEEVKPPLPRSATVKKPLALPTLDKKPISPKPLPSLKRSSPLRETSVPSDKRAKLSLEPPVISPTDEKKGAIKLIPPKPKPMVLQESDMFMDALTASTKSKEPRKRKRRTSISKDGTTDSKKSEKPDTEGGPDSPQHPSSPQSADDRSPLGVKPNFKFYQDTLETDEDKEDKTEEDESSDKVKCDGDDDDDDETNITNVVKNEIAATMAKNEAKQAEDDVEAGKVEAESPDAEEAISETLDFNKNGRSVSPLPEIRYVDGLRSVLLLQKRKGPKKSLKWKTELESVRYFELDETERVNVTKTFTDMKQMEKQNEREAFQMARKLSTEDLMEEKTRWKALTPIDLQPALVEPGKESREKDIQYAREKGILQALYFNRSMIPDSAAEPDEERHHAMTDPKIIPLEDLTGNKESEKDFTGVAWPEPKPHSTPPQPPVMQPPGYHFPVAFGHNQPPMMPPMGPQGPMGPMPPMGPQGPMPMGPGPMNQMGPDMGGAMPGPTGGGGGGGWRTGDGKVVVPDLGMNPMQQSMPPNMPGNFPPGMDGPPGMVPPGMMGPPMYNQQDGFGMMGPEDMGFGNYQGPPGPGMFGPGHNFPPGPPRGGGPMHGGNRGRGNGPGWFRGGGVGGGGPMRGGGGGGGGGWRGGWRGNGKQPPICRQFTKNGFCRVGDKCQYLHPGVNCPPF